MEDNYVCLCIFSCQVFYKMSTYMLQLLWIRHGIFLLAFGSRKIDPEENVFLLTKFFLPKLDQHTQELQKAIILPTWKGIVHLRLLGCYCLGLQSTHWQTLWIPFECLELFWIPRFPLGNGKYLGQIHLRCYYSFQNLLCFVSIAG